MQDIKKSLVSNKVKLLMVVTLCSGSLANAALPPEHQNSNDLDSMLSYVRANPTVMSSLQAIDLLSQTIFYGEGCTAVFERLAIEKPEGWTGPADPLVIKEDSCPNYDDMDDMYAAGMDGEESITFRETDSCSVDVEEASCTP